MLSAFMTATAGILGALLTALFARASIRTAASRAYGELTRTVAEHERRLDDNDKDQIRQWDRIIDTEINVANLRGRHKLNGGHE